MNRTNNSHQSVYEKTLTGLVQGIKVSHIATNDLDCCGPDDYVHEVLDCYPDFDQIPVKDNGFVIGVLERVEERFEKEKVIHHMRRINDEILVAEELPLSKFIPLMKIAPFYRLVLIGNKINGVVTRSDLLKLPVRLLAFSKITQLEMTMAILIRLHWREDEGWLNKLSSVSRGIINHNHNNAKAFRSDPPKLEFSSFKDKGLILKSIYEQRIGNDFLNNLDELYVLRNLIAHAGNYAENEEQIINFISLLESVDHWIDEIDLLITKHIE
jgi:predicted transcriptional regulator